jgi:lysozyme
MNLSRLRDQLKVDEGVKYFIYLDHLGYPTFGIGHLMVQSDSEWGLPVGTRVSEERVNEVFEKDVIKFISETTKLFPNLDNMPEIVQESLVNMCFNLGRPRLSQFVKFIEHINAERYLDASIEMLNSRWATQVGQRAIRLSNNIKSAQV